MPRSRPDSARIARLDPRNRPTLDQPRWVMLRSLVLPGWGQLHNRSWLKAAGVAAGEVSLVTGIVKDERELRRLSRVVDQAQADNDTEGYNAAVLAYNDRLDRSLGRRWWLGGLLAYALLDAYVDAHFVDFDVEFESDPALPDGVQVPGGRLGVRWHW